tara:strand:+ start:5873 stop:6130 length:258 start_codon:yes stop_codon:yes gene_type:complete
MLQPIQNRVLVLLDRAKEESKGGIFIPKKSQETEKWGEVIAVGKDVEQVAVGEVVYITPTQGTLYNEGGRSHVIVQDTSILCKKF